MRKQFIGIFWIIGIILFVVILQRIGLRQVWDRIRQLSVLNFFILFVIRFIYWVLRTANWNIVLNKFGGRASFVQLFEARMAGHAISYLTPSAHLGGEPIRALMVKNLDKKRALASVIVDKTIELMATVLFMILGILVAVTKLSLPAQYKMMFIAAMIISALFVLVLFIRQKRGFFGWIFNGLDWLGLKFSFLNRYREKIQETDRLIKVFYQEHKTTFLVVFIAYCFLLLFWTVEIHFTLLFLGVQGISLLDSFLIVTLGVLAFLIPAIPAALGTYEVTYAVIFVLMGLGAGLGVTLTIIRRLLALLWAGIGLLIMLKRQVKKS